MNRTADSTELVRRLEEALEGSRALDDAIWATIEGHGYEWREGKRPLIRIPACYCSERVAPHVHDKSFGPGDGGPHHSTSIDAKLPWEKIVRVAAPDWNSAKPAGRWEAACATGEDGHAVYGYGHTEALARRVAAIKAQEEPEGD